MASAAGTQPVHVDIVSIVSSVRRQSESVTVATRVRFAEARAEGLRECTGVSVGFLRVFSPITDEGKPR